MLQKAYVNLMMSKGRLYYMDLFKTRTDAKGVQVSHAPNVSEADSSAHRSLCIFLVLFPCLPYISIHTINEFSFPFFSFNGDAGILLIELIIIALFFANLTRHGFQSLKLSPALLWFILFICLAVLSVFMAGAKNYGNILVPLLKVLRMLVYIAVYFVFYWNYKREYSRSFICSLFIGGCIFGAIGIAGYILQLPGLVADQIIWSSIPGLSGHFRAGGFIGDASAFGALASLYIIFSMLIAFRKDSDSTLIKLALLCLLTNTVALCCSWTRAGFVALFVAFLVIALTHFDKEVDKGRMAIVAAVVLLLAAFLYFTTDIVASTIHDRILPLLGVFGGDIQNVSSGRTLIWNQGLDAFRSGTILQQVFGHGYKIDTEISLVDNNYLYVLISTGTLGFVAFLGFWISMAKSLWAKKNQRGKAYPIVSIARICFISFLVLMIFADQMTMPLNMCLMFILLGCVEKILSL